MQEAAHIDKISESSSGQTPAQRNLVDRIITAWALSEAALGGVLHALRLPFTGLFVGGMAVVFIILLARFDSRRYGILRATLLVMIVKLLVSPHAPINAYLAIAFQGLTGTLLFRFIKNIRVASLLLGILCLLQSSLQKLLIITLVFGMNFWKATDLFVDYVLGQVPFLGAVSESVSIVGLITALYISLHLSFGVIIGVWAPLLARKIQQANSQDTHIYLFRDTETKIREKVTRKRRLSKKITYLFVFGLSFAIFFLSYFVPVFEETRGVEALIMILRSLIIISAWYFVLGPFLMQKLRSFLEKKESRYQSEIRQILNLLPVMQAVVIKNWRQSAPLKNPRRIPHFIQSVLIHILLAEF